VDRDELLKMLDLSGKEAGPEEATDLPLTPAEPEAKRTEPASHTALDLDEWALRKGRDLLRESERLRALRLGEHTIADFHAAAFLPDPRLLPDCVDPRRREFLAQLFETPEYHALHATTTLQEAASAVAATAFAEQFAALNKDEMDHAAGTATPASGRDAPGKKAPDKEAMDREMETLRAVGCALSAATEEVEEMREATTALGMGPGSPGSNDPRAIATLYRRVRGNAHLRRICELAGRYRRVAQSRQRQKVTHGMDDLVGVTLDGDPGKLLPVELARLAIPELELDTLRRLVERQCMARDYRCVEPVARGPIIVSVDESGSMSGEKAHTAKVLALAMAWIARQQKRWCALVAYSGDTAERLLPLPPGRWNEMKVADWLCAFIGGGSYMDVPVREMPGYYRQLDAPRGRTDLLFITDAICRLGEEVKRPFMAWKQSVQARLITLVIDSEPGDLSAISDEVHQVSSLSVTEEGVERVLSI
jgi:uncharacterized protein with von Willebrand factor type A (vWA) domain